MKRLPVYILASLILPLAGKAEDLTLQNNRVLKDVHVLDIGVDTIKIQHENGIATIKAHELPEAWQEKYKLTQEEVTLRKDMEKKRRDDAWRKQRDSLLESERNPRYLTSTDILKISNSGGVKMILLEAEVAAAKWNTNEAFRLGDKEMYEYYNNIHQSLQPQLTAVNTRKMNEEQEKKKKEKAWETEKAEMKLKLAKYETIMSGQKQENKRLNDSLSEWEKRDRRTIVNNWDTGGWRWNNQPDVIVVPSRPIYPHAPRPRPIINIETNKVRPNHAPPSSPVISQPAPPSSTNTYPSTPPSHEGNSQRMRMR